LKEVNNLNIVADASAILCAVFPDEASDQAKLLMKDYALGKVDFYGPSLIILELLNSCLIAKRRGRISQENLEKLVEELSGLQIKWVDIENHPLEIFYICSKFNISSYDASYIISAKLMGSELVTADRRLYNSVRNDMPFVRLIDNYQNNNAQ
jgi:predicted nucleic acid-binding protein